jgi:hypothetical protein
MASQSVLFTLQRLWEYITVSSQEDMFATPEEDDPVRAFLEEKGRGVEQGDTRTAEEESPVELTHAKTSIDGAVRRPELLGIPADTGVDAVFPEDETTEELSPVAEDEDEEEDMSAGPMADSAQDEPAERPVAPSPAEAPLATAKDETEQAAAETAGTDTDDMLDIFRSEKQERQDDGLLDGLSDISMRALLDETQELMDEIKRRRYGRR